ncbi:MAG: molecular chaperone DnaK, partial [Treponema sp.]|nr:molecular chaperone DnaK [Treponema sp.]
KAEEAIADLRRSLEGDDIRVIKEKTEILKQVSYKIAEEVYKQTGGGAQQPGPDAAAGESGPQGGASSGENTKSAEDADYEVVDDK